MDWKRRHRAFILLYFCAITLLGGYNFFQVVHQATDQNIFVSDPRGVRIIYIEKGGASDRAGLKVGDIITRINGQTFRNAREADILLQKEYIGKTLEYEILRNGKPMTIHVRLAPFGVQLFYLLTVLLGILYGLLGLFVGVSRPHLKEARLFAYATITLNFALWLRVIPRPSQSSELFYRVMFFLDAISVLMSMLLLFTLSFYFPDRRFGKEISIRKRLFFLYSVGGIILLFLIGAGFGFYRMQWLSFLFLLFLGLGLAALNHKHRYIREEYRKKSKYLRYNNFLLIFVTLLSVALYIFSRARTPFTSYLPYVLFPLFLSPVFIFITIQRYRIFDLTIIIRKNWIYYTVTSLHTAFTVFILILLINHLPNIRSYLPVILFHESSVEILSIEQMNSSGGAPQEGVLLGYGILFTLLILWVHRKTRSLIDRRFFQSKYDYRTALREFSPLGLIAPNEEILARQVIENVDNIMHLKQIALCLKENDTFVIKAQKGFALPNHFQLTTETVAPLVANPHSFIELTRFEDNQFRSLIEAGALYVQCVRSKSQNLGFLILGEKRSETPFNKEDLELLQIIATQIAIAIENINLHREFSEKERLAHELNMAREIQLQSLPRPHLHLPPFDLFAHLVPAREVGGDYYDYFVIEPHLLAVLIGDVAGKGMPAALFMSRIQGILRSLKHLHASPRELLGELNRILYHDLPRNSFFTLSYLLLDARQGRYTLVRAGHNESLHFQSEKEGIEILQPTGMGLGLDPGDLFLRKLEVAQGNFREGDTFLLFTDGVTETFSPENVIFGEERLVQLFKKFANRSAREVVEGIEKALQEFRGERERFDDATLIAIRIVRGGN